MLLDGGHRITPNPDGTIESYCVTSFISNNVFSLVVAWSHWILRVIIEATWKKKRDPFPRVLTFLAAFFTRDSMWHGDNTLFNSVAVLCSDENSKHKTDEPKSCFHLVSIFQPENLEPLCRASAERRRHHLIIAKPQAMKPSYPEPKWLLPSQQLAGH